MAVEDKRNFFNNPNYESFIVKFNGDFENELASIPYAYGKIIWGVYGVVSVEKGRYTELVLQAKTIVYAEPRGVFIQQNTPIESSNIENIVQNPYVNLDGTGILIGIIDSGIDYLNAEFMREDDTTRISSIWDQTITSNSGTNVLFGEEYSEEIINKAIELKKSGGDPYSIVPSKDTDGHGTNIASIVGARGINQTVKGILPKCKFIIVKLKENDVYKDILAEDGIKDVPVYSNANIFMAIEYIIRTVSKLNSPIVMILSLGSNAGNHLGTAILEQYIDNIGTYRGVLTVVGVGNQGGAELHTSGIVKGVGSNSVIELNISKKMQNLIVDIWVEKPNIMSLNIISPYGQSTKNIPIQVINEEVLKFIYEDTEVRVVYREPDQLNGNEHITMSFKNIKPGIWKFILTGEYILDGRYDAWLPMKELLPEGTKFLKPDSFGTLVNPSSSNIAISVGYVNQTNYSTVSESGKGFYNNKIIKPDIVAGGMNQPVTNPGGKVTLMSGSCVAAAVVAGACGMILEWGIVDGNDRSMYSEKVKSYLIIGARRRGGEIYPNSILGYGVLDVGATFNQIAGMSSSQYRHMEWEYSSGKVYYRIPKEVRGELFERRKGRLWIFR